MDSPASSASSLDLDDLGSPQGTSRSRRASQTSHSGSQQLIKELKKVHTQKVKVLMKANDQLRKDLIQAKKEGKDNYRVKMIKSLRAQVRENETIIETLKQLAMSNGASVDEIADAVEDELSKPKRLRRPSVEALQKTIAQLQRKVARLQKKQVKLTSSSRPSTPSTRPSSAASHRSVGLAASGHPSELEERVQVLTTELQVRDQVVAAHKSMIEQQQAQLRALHGVQHELEVMTSQYHHTLAEMEQVRTELLQSVAENEQFYQEMRVLQNRLEHQNTDFSLGSERQQQVIQQQQLTIDHLTDVQQKHEVEIQRLQDELASAQQIAAVQHQSASHAQRAQVSMVAASDSRTQTQAQQYEQELLKMQQDHQAEVKSLKMTIQSTERRLAEVQLDCDRKIAAARRSLEDKSTRWQAERQRLLKDKKDRDDSVQTKKVIQLHEEMKEMSRKSNDMAQRLDESKTEIARLTLQLRDREKKHRRELTTISQAASGSDVADTFNQKLADMEKQRDKLQEEYDYQQLLANHLKTSLQKYVEHVGLLEKQMRAGRRKPPPRPDLRPKT